MGTGGQIPALSSQNLSNKTKVILTRWIEIYRLLLPLLILNYIDEHLYLKLTKKKNKSKRQMRLSWAST